MDYKIPTNILVSKNLFMGNEECWKQQVLRVREVQNITKGKGAVLGYLDDGIGINLEIADLDIERLSFFGKSANNGDHSTYGATLIAGKSLGIFPEMKFLSKQVMDPSSGTGGSKQIVSAIMYAASNQIKTINLSLGSNRPDSSIEKALKYYCSNGINIATVAAGNDGPDQGTSDWPANYAKSIKGVLSVAATQIDKEGNITVALFSSRGIITLGAPGNGLKSMDSRNNIDFISGTSYSAPIVGATIAVARTLIDRDITQDEILGIFEETCTLKELGNDIGNGNIAILDFLKRVETLNSVPVHVTKKSMFSCWSNIFN